MHVKKIIRDPRDPKIFRGTNLGGRELEPEDEDGLECVIEGDVVEDDGEGKGLEEVEEAKSDPVGEPLDVILVSGRLDGLEGEVGGESPADEIGDGGSEGVYEHKQNEQEGRANDAIALGDLCPLLELVQDGVSRELDGV